jgi:hypothetical protein
VRRPSQTWRTVSPSPADVGIRQLLVFPELPHLSRFGLFRHVAFTNPFTARSPDLRLLNLSHPPRSCHLLAGGAGPRLAKRPRQRLGLDAANPAKIIESEENHHQLNAATPYRDLTSRTLVVLDAQRQRPSGSALDKAWQDFIDTEGTRPD